MVDLDLVYREHATTVYRFLLAKTGFPAIAEELTQETFYQAVRCIDKFDGSCKITTWLCGIARNLLLDHLRHKDRQDESVDDVSLSTPSAEELVLSELNRETILQSIHRVPEPGREVLYLRLLGEMSFSQIGGILGQSETWARVTYYRAKIKLLKELN